MGVRHSLTGRVVVEPRQDSTILLSFCSIIEFDAILKVTKWPPECQPSHIYSRQEEGGRKQKGHTLGFWELSWKTCPVISASISSATLLAWKWVMKSFDCSPGHFEQAFAQHPVLVFFYLIWDTEA